MRTKERLASTVEHNRVVARDSVKWFAGISRHGIIAAERVTKGPRTRSTFRHVMSQFAGSIFIGLGVSLFVHARLGVPAYDVMLTAIRDHLGVSLGIAGMFLTSILFVIATFLGHRPRLSGLFYMIGNGISVDVWMRLIRDPELLSVRILFVVLGTLAIAAGVALVVHAGLTGGALELLMNAAEERGIEPFRARQVIELSIVVGGVLLGGDIGIATAFFVLTMSPALKAGKQALSDHRMGRDARLTV